MKKSIICSLKVSFLICLFLSLGNLHIEAQTNIAYNKQTKQSTNFSPNAGFSGNAVDGNTNGRWSGKSVTHTKAGGVNPWWEVDLGDVYYIDEVRLWNRIDDCCISRLNNIAVVTRTEESAPWEAFSTVYRYKKGQANPLIIKKEKMARYIRVSMKTPKGVLSLAEVEVYGSKVVPLPSGSSNTDQMAATIDALNDVGDEVRGVTDQIRSTVDEVESRFSSATYVGAPEKCGPGTFTDPAYPNTCFSCPDGFKRTVFSVSSNKACERPATELLKPAIKHGKGGGLFGTDCNGGQFWDPNGYCYSCPNGFNRTAHPVTSSKACSQRVPAGYTTAQKIGKSGCTSGFLDVGKNQCYTCPEGTKRTIFAVDSDKACERVY